MGLTEDFETSLQVLRGFDTDITLEVNEIKVSISSLVCSLIIFHAMLVFNLVLEEIFGILCQMRDHTLCSFIVYQRSVASSSKRTAIRFSELKRKRYRYPLMVNLLVKLTWLVCLSSPHFLKYISLLVLAQAFLSNNLWGVIVSPTGWNWTIDAPATKWYQWCSLLFK